MYRTCIYCNRKLGGNEMIEKFPVGRRLAFDSAQGRLWVICDRCRRWNLSPLDDRWEAIDDCERCFRATRLRYSTDNIGLARLREGLELVRIGRPMRPEFAAWRYGKQFIRRHFRRTVQAFAQAVGYTLTVFATLPLFFLTDENAIVVARVRDEEGRRLAIARKDLKELQIVPGEAPGDWSLAVPYRPREKFGWLRKARGAGQRMIKRLEGSAAIRAASHVLPTINSFGGSGQEVRDAVRLIEEVGEPERLFGEAPRIVGATRFTLMDTRTRLALEMAAHEESERRAMEGELAALEAAWQEAEEIAAIADRLFLPESIESWIEKEKRQQT